MTPMQTVKAAPDPDHKAHPRVVPNCSLVKELNACAAWKGRSGFLRGLRVVVRLAWPPED